MNPSGAAQPRLFVLYVAALILAAGLGLAASLPTIVWDLLPLGVALGLLVLAELGSIRLPDGWVASAAAAVEIASILVLGPAATVWLAAGSILLVRSIARRSPSIHAALHAGVTVVTVLLAGAAFERAGGRVGAVELPRDLAPLLLCAATYLLAHNLLVSLALGLGAGPSSWRALRRVFRHGLLYQGAAVALGCLGGVALLLAGFWALPLFIVPFLAARHAVGLYAGMRHDFGDFVRALADVLDEVDPYTRQHSARVCQYAVRLALAMKCTEREVEDVEVAALVHDLGKIGPQHQRILHKAGRLSSEEQRTMRSHPAAGAGIIGKVRSLARAAEIVRLHHERPDGRGYPFGVRAEDAPLGARILNVADAFDAMTSDRPYRPALEVETALVELERGAGIEFDRGVVDCLVRLHGAGRFPLVAGPGAEDIRLLKVRSPHVRA